MTKANVFVLVRNENKYDNFIKVLEEHFKILNVHSTKDTFLKNIASSVYCTPFVLFVEYPFAAEVSEYLHRHFNPSSYIVAVFYSTPKLLHANCTNVFDFINTSSKCFDKAFLFNKLNRQLSSLRAILLLKSEVKEFYEIGNSLSAEKDTIKLFEMIINSSISLTSSDAGTIYLVIDSKSGNWSSIDNGSYSDKLLKFAIAKNMSMDVNLEASTFPINKQSVSGHTILTGKTLRINDAYDLDPSLDYCHDRSYDTTTGYVTKSILSIPMKDHDNKVMGVIQLINKKVMEHEKLDFSGKQLAVNVIPYDYTDELIMNSLAGQAAVALENNLLYRDMHNLLQSYVQQNSELEYLSRKILKAHEEERKRIAREIHDGPAQSIVNLSLKVELCKKYYQINNSEKLIEELTDLSGSIRSTAKEIRSIIYDLKPSYLEDGLLKALENHFNVFRENTGINVTFTTSTADMQIEYYMASTIYRIVQEALTNIFKHAHASSVNVDFSTTEGNILLTITDNGKGFDTSKLLDKNLDGGFGLEGMKERVELLKGHLVIVSSRDEGTSIVVRIPVE